MVSSGMKKKHKNIVHANLPSIGLVVSSDPLSTIGACCVVCDGVAAAVVLRYANSLIVGALHKSEITEEQILFKQMLGQASFHYCHYTLEELLHL